MIAYSYLRDNLPWQGTWSELRAFLQNWRKELKLDLNSSVDISFRVKKDYSVTAYLNIPNFGCDSKDINLSKMCLKEVNQEDYWRLLASCCDFLGNNASLNSIRVTSEITGDEVLWKNQMKINNE